MCGESGIAHTFCAVEELFGKESYKDKRLNKKYISNIVFRDAGMLQKLNSIVHPAVREHFLAWAKSQNAPYVIQETALIFENEAQKNYDVIVLVTSRETVRIQRVSDRDSVDKESVKQRIDNQLHDDEKIPKSDFVIENTDIRDTELAVKRIHKQLLAQSAKTESF